MNRSNFSLTENSSLTEGPARRSQSSLSSLHSQGSLENLLRVGSLVHHRVFDSEPCLSDEECDLSFYEEWLRHGVPQNMPLDESLIFVKKLGEALNVVNSESVSGLEYDSGNVCEYDSGNVCEYDSGNVCEYDSGNVCESERGTECGVRSHSEKRLEKGQMHTNEQMDHTVDEKSVELKAISQAHKHRRGRKRVHARGNCMRLIYGNLHRGGCKPDTVIRINQDSKHLMSVVVSPKRQDTAAAPKRQDIAAAPGSLYTSSIEPMIAATSRGYNALIRVYGSSSSSKSQGWLGNGGIVASAADHLCELLDQTECRSVVGLELLYFEVKSSKVTSFYGDKRDGLTPMMETYDMNGVSGSNLSRLLVGTIVTSGAALRDYFTICKQQSTRDEDAHAVLRVNLIGRDFISTLVLHDNPVNDYSTLTSCGQPIVSTVIDQKYLTKSFRSTLFYVSEADSRDELRQVTGHLASLRSTRNYPQKANEPASLSSVLGLHSETYIR